MAEFVQLRKEKWAEPLGLLVQLDILRDYEFSSVLENLDKFQYKIQSHTRSVEDVLEFIQFECNLLKLIQERRKFLKQYDLSEEVDRFIYNEIRSQFGSSEITFSHTVDFWNAKLKFIADIVPDQDKENEFNILFKKALTACGRANLEIYLSCVDYLWTFANRPPLLGTPKKRKKHSSRRDISKLITNIRYFTMEAVRNFPENPDASIWFIKTELKYLQLLQEEDELSIKNPNVESPYNTQDEVQQSGKLIDVVFNDIVKKNAQTPAVYIKLYNAIRLFPLSEARMLSKKTYANIILIKQRTPEVYAWLLERSIDDNKIVEFIERINQALSVSGPKIKNLEICIQKLNCFVEKLELTRDPDNCLLPLLEFYTKLLHKDNLEWNQVSSEVLHSNRILIIKKLPRYIEILSENENDSLFANLQLFQKEHNIDEVVRQFVKVFPSSFVLVRERVLQLLSLKEKKMKPALVCKYLSKVNWKHCENDDGLKLLMFIYYAFLTVKRFSKENNILIFLKMSSTTVPGINEIRLMHLKKMYMEDVERGREFYKKFRLLTTDWRLSSEVVKIETTACRCNGVYSDRHVLHLAYEDAIRLAGTCATEPWKVCITSQNSLKKEKEAGMLMERALKQFSGKQRNETDNDEYKDLLLFSKTFATKIL